MSKAKSKQASTQVDVVRCAVVITPCAEGPALRAMLIAAAKQAGYTWRDEAEFFSEPSFIPESRLLMICSDASMLNGIQVWRAAVVLGPLSTAMRSPAALRSADHRDGLINVSRSLAMAAEFVGRFPTAKVIQWDPADSAPALEALFAALNLPLDISDQSRLAHDLQISLASETPVRQRLQFRSAADPALAIYREGLPQTGARAWWERSLFRSDYADHVCPPVIDITGRGRFLFYGPYFILPAGRWRATAKFSLSEEGARRPYVLEFFADEQIMTVVRVWPSGAGDYAIEIESELQEAAAIQIRLFLASPALHGEFRLEGVEIECLALGAADEIVA